MKRIKLALEELDTNCDVQECLEDTTISDLEKDDQLISLQQDDLNQAEDISATIDTLTTNVDTATGLSDEAAQVLNVVTEHFCRRLGYKHPIVPALESFNDTTRVQNTKLAIENLQKLNTQLNKCINLAQESLLDSIFESIVGVFSKEKELKMEVKRLKEETKNKQTTTATIRAKNWTTHLRTDSSVISGKDVLEITGKLKKSLTSNEIFKTISELSNALDSIKMDVKSSFFKVNENTFNRVSGKYNDIRDITNAFSRDFIIEGKRDMKTLTPLTEEERIHILDDVETILTNKEMDKEIESLKKSIEDLNSKLNDFLNTNPASLAVTGLLAANFGVGALSGIGSTEATGAALAATGATLPVSIPVFIGAAIGASLVIHAGIWYLAMKGTRKDIMLTEDSKSFKLIINKTIKEIEEIISNYRNLTSEKLKICSAALNYVKASTH